MICGTIMREGHKLYSFFFILSGSVRRVGESKIVVELGPFKYLGL